MDFSPSKPNILSSNRLTLDYKKPNRLYHCHSEMSEAPNYKPTVDKEALNLFKGIVKIKTKNINNESPIIRYKSNNNNIFDFTNDLYNNEEHLSKNQIFNSKISKKFSNKSRILSPIKSFHHRLSINEKSERSQSSMAIPNLSKEKNINIIKKSLFQKNSNNYSGFSSKRKPRKNIIGINKNEETDNNKKTPNKYSFFFKLKEKEKNPSKTPYLDKKFWKSSYNLPKYNVDNKTINNDNAKENNNSLIKKNKSIKNKIDIRDNDIKEKNNTIKDDNNIILKDNIFEKKTIRYDNIINNNNENKNIFINKNEKKNKKKITINILHKPFFCCLKS